jgi:hypothetical protein
MKADSDAQHKKRLLAFPWPVWFVQPGLAFAAFASPCQSLCLGAKTTLS